MNIKNRLSHLEQSSGGKRIVPVCLLYQGETANDAISRHLLTHSEDSAADIVVVDTGIYPPRRETLR